MRRVVVVSVALVLVLFFGGADASYGASSWRITGILVPGSSAGAPYFPFNVPNTAWGVATSGEAWGYAALMYLHNYRVGDDATGLPLTFTSSPVIRDSILYCDNFYSGCTGELLVPNSNTASGVYSLGGTYLAWVHTGTNQVASGHIDVINPGMGLEVDFVVPSKAPSQSTIEISWSFVDSLSFGYAEVEKVYYAWHGATGWREHSFTGNKVYIGGDDYKIDDNVTVGSGHLLVMFRVKRKVCTLIVSGKYGPYCAGSVWYYGYFMRDVWVGDFNVGSALSGGVVEMPETGYVDVLYRGGWYPVSVPRDLGYTCNWTSKPPFLSEKGTGGCQLEGIPDTEGMYQWGLMVTASNGENITYSGQIIVRRFEDVVGRPGGTGLATWIIGLTNTASTGIGSIVMSLDHSRVVVTNAVKGLNVQVDDSLSSFDTSKISDFVAYGKGLLPPGAGLPIAAWIAVTGIDVALAFMGVVKGVIKWW